MEIVPYYLTFLVDSQLFFQKNCYNFFYHVYASRRMFYCIGEKFPVMQKSFRKPEAFS